MVIHFCLVAIKLKSLGKVNAMNRSMAAVNDKIVKLPFRLVTGTSISKTAATVVVTELELKPSNMGDRVAAIALCFEYFRITKLRLKTYSSVVGPVHYDSSTLNVNLGVLEGYMATAYEPSDTSRTGAPTNLAGMSGAAVFETGSLYETYRQVVPRNVLLGTPVKWFDTTATGTPPSGNQVQGLVWVYSYNNNPNDSTNGASVNVVIEGEIEFKGMISPSLSFTKTIAGSKDEKDAQDDFVQVLQHGPPVILGAGAAVPGPQVASDESRMNGTIQSCQRVKSSASLRPTDRKSVV